MHSQELPERVAGLVADTRAVERLVEEVIDGPVKDLRVLDVGAGQNPFHMAYFARQNDVVGIDLDVIPEALDVRSYARMLAANGPRRVLKTMGRKLAGIDRRYRAELSRQLGVRRLPRLRVLQMDATRMSFADASFDFVHCRSLLQVLPQPANALGEITRVARSGGVVYASIHLFTSDNGSLDPRVMRGDAGLPLWPHLRPATRNLVLQNTFLNRLRLAEWESLFRDCMPGCRIMRTTPANDAYLRGAATELQAAGELSCYSLDELVTRRLSVLWRKG